MYIYIYISLPLSPSTCPPPGIVQYNLDNRVGPGSNITVAVACNIMTNGVNTTDPQSTLSAHLKLNSLLQTAYATPCWQSSYADFVQQLKNTTFSSPFNQGGTRQWTWQTCTEFAYFQTTDSSSQPFGTYMPLSFSQQQCVDIYSVPMIDDKLIQQTNTFYGGKNGTFANTIFVNGSLDPWHVLSVTDGPLPATVDSVIVDSGMMDD